MVATGAAAMKWMFGRLAASLLRILLMYACMCDKDGCDFNPYRLGDKRFLDVEPTTPLLLPESSR